MLAANEMTFGVEFECFVPVAVYDAQGMSRGGYHRPVQVVGLPAGWCAQSDTSLRTERRGYVAVEITSPVLRGREGLEQVMAVLGQLNTWNAKVNPTCGTHVHVAADWTNNVKALRNLVHLTARFERALYAITGTKRREHGHYAAPMNTVFERVKNCQTLDGFRRAAVNRYHSLNITNLLNGRFPTVEFRVFQGTLNPVKVAAYVQVCLGLCENAHAMQRTPKAVCTNTRHQDGRGLLYRMGRNFNWYSEKRMGTTTYGLLIPEQLPAIKRELERLADKYDADQSVAQHAALRGRV